jgi:hypothetical protein
MISPKFYCKNFIEIQGNLKKYQPKDCKQQCHSCMDVIIDFHFNKKEVNNNEKKLHNKNEV